MRQGRPELLRQNVVNITIDLSAINHTKDISLTSKPSCSSTDLKVLASYNDGWIKTPCTSSSPSCCPNLGNSSHPSLLEVLFPHLCTSPFALDVTSLQVIWPRSAVYIDNNGFLHRSWEVSPQLGTLGRASRALGHVQRVHQAGGEEAKRDNLAGDPRLPLRPAEQLAHPGADQPGRGHLPGGASCQPTPPPPTCQLLTR